MSVGLNNVPAGVFLLLRKGILTPDIFICPSVTYAKGDDWGGKLSTAESAAGRGNFTCLYGNDDGGTAHNYLTGPDLNLCYSIQVPYPSLAGLQTGWVWGTSMDAEAPLAADMNPGTQDAADTVTFGISENDIQKGNSRNHKLRGAKQGQNVVYADGHVAWETTPYCGMYRTDLTGNGTGALKWRDNIFRAEPAGTETANSANFHNTNPACRPTEQKDALLMPTLDSQ
jgi:prepilin-type processing-associated H-X9-DG protein